jgi:NADPH-dependent curcumin reductase CurA
VLVFDSTGSSQMVLKYTFDNIEMLKVTDANMNVFDSTSTLQMELKYTFDNMGGEMLEVEVANMNAFGGVAACGEMQSLLSY